jgi:putative ABC transport system ATP-binding protein
MTTPEGAEGATVDLANIHKTYRAGGTGAQVVAAAGVTLHVPSGQAVAITGPSGSGKSTLLHLIGAMDTPDDGTITIDGREITALSERDRATVRRGIGFVFQRFHLLPALTVLDNVTAPVLPYKTDFDRNARAHDILEAVGLDDRAGDLPHRLSGGQQQRVAIARALINNPRLLLADEPTGNLDSQTGRDVMRLLLDLRKQGRTLVIATHDAEIAAQCDRLVRLVDGQITDDALLWEGHGVEPVLRRMRGRAS